MSFLKAAPDGGTSLGSSLGINPSDVKTFGTAMNGIANAGGASPGYGAQQGAPPQAPPQTNNVMQMLSPDWLRAIMDHFRGSYQ